MLIYKITNTVNGKVYIGQTTKRASVRFIHHRSTLRNGKHHNSHLQSAWNKDGETSFTFEVIEEFDCGLNFDIDNLERCWIERYNSMNPKCGYNKVSGGNTNKTASDETKAKISLAGMGRKYSEESKLKMSLSSKGKVFTRQHKENLIKSKRSRVQSNCSPIVDVVTGATFRSVRDAAASIGICHVTLLHWLSGKYRNKSNFRYKE